MIQQKDTLLLLSLVFGPEVMVSWTLALPLIGNIVQNYMGLFLFNINFLLVLFDFLAAVASN